MPEVRQVSHEEALAHADAMEAEAVRRLLEAQPHEVLPRLADLQVVRDEAQARRALVTTLLERGVGDARRGE